MKEEQEKRKPKIFPVPFALGKIKENISITTNRTSELPKEEIINQIFQNHSKGNILEAEKYYQIFISQGFQDHRIFSNYGIILYSLGKLKDAELSLRKAIELKPNYAEAQNNLGIILKGLSKLQDAEWSYRKAIELKPNYAEAHYNLGITLQELNKLEDAEFSYRQAVEINPNYSNAHSNLGNLLRELRKLQDAELSTRKAISLNPNFAEAHLNLGNLLRELGKLQDAELSSRKAISLNPNFAEAHLNLGPLLINIGKLQDAELSTRKAISLNPNLAKAYFNLSTLNSSSENTSWEDQLFSESILNSQRKKNLVDIYFARANILEKKFHFSEASNNLKKANDLNRNIYGSDYSAIKKNINTFYQAWEKKKQKNTIYSRKFPIPIFIVGMPRSGKTITESILACNNKLIKDGESLTLEKAIKLYLSNKESSQNKSLSEIYFDQIEVNLDGKSFISTTTPYNLIYTGLTIRQIHKAKFIFCYRNPLDNILEIYKKNFGNRHTYSSSIIESANLWIKFYSIIEKYKEIYDSKIYFLSYDKLVTNTKEETKNLINWLEWRNDNKYLEPKIDPTTLKITDKLNSKIINKNELSNWKNYKDLLKPAIDIFNNNTKFKNLFQQYENKF